VTAAPCAESLSTTGKQADALKYVRVPLYKIGDAPVCTDLTGPRDLGASKLLDRRKFCYFWHCVQSKYISKLTMMAR